MKLENIKWECLSLSRQKYNHFCSNHYCEKFIGTHTIKDIIRGFDVFLTTFIIEFISFMFRLTLFGRSINFIQLE